MLSEEQKNVVCFSNLMARHYSELFHQLDAILNQEKVEHHTIMHTADYWCRDYMPVQCKDDRFVQFKYYPDYLLDDSSYITDVNRVIERMRFTYLQTIKSEIILDGGNLVSCPGRDTTFIVMTDKPLAENKGTNLPQTEEFTEIFGTSNIQIVWLPWDKEERFGHTDGMLRYVGQNANGKPIVLTNLSVYDDEYAAKVKQILQQYFEVVALQLSQYDELSWAYINAIQTDSVIIIPGIANPVLDGEALTQYKALYPQYTGHIYQVQMRDFIQEGGGALNCCSWTYKTDN